MSKPPKTCAPDFSVITSYHPIWTALFLLLLNDNNNNSNIDDPFISFFHTEDGDDMVIN